MAAVDDARAWVDRLAAELGRRRPQVKARLDAYRGDHKLRFASPRFAAYFEEQYAGFSDNWCAPVIQATTERMNVQGMRLPGEQRTADQDLLRVWKANDCERGSSEAFVVCLAAARTYALVWGNPADEQTPRITWEHPANAIVAYDPDTRERVAGLKLWDDDGVEYATLYRPDAVWKFERRSGTGSALVLPATWTAAARGWEPRQPAGDDSWPLPNPLGEVPLVEFRNQTLLDDKPISDLDGVAAMQAAINLVWAYLLNALDFASLPQRVVLGADIPTVPVLDNDGQVVGQRPVELDTLPHESVLWVPGEQAKIAEWSTATLQGFTSTLEKAVEHVAAQTRTPPHYLIGKVANLSADAMTAAETGQVSKAGERVTYCTHPVREVHRLIAIAQGNPGKAQACTAGIVAWKDIQFRSLAQRVDAITKMRQIGFPLEWVAEQYGLDPAEVERVMGMVRAEAELDPIGALSRLAGQNPAGEPPAPAPVAGEE